MQDTCSVGKFFCVNNFNLVGGFGVTASHAKDPKLDSRQQLNC